MSEFWVKKLLKQSEGRRLEFKESRAHLPSTLFETVCAFLNREGGDILLGVQDNGQVVGVDRDRVEILKSNIVNLSNNPQKLDPPFVLLPHDREIDGKVIIHLQVPESFTPFPKNPLLSKFFIQLGRAEELGSGILNVNRLIRHYAPGQKPQFLEGDVFRTIVPVPLLSGLEQVTEQVTEQVHRVVVSLGKEVLPGQELMDRIGLSHRPTFLYSYLRPALAAELIEMTIPDKPRSTKQRYRLTPKGKQILRGLAKRPEHGDEEGEL